MFNNQIQLQSLKYKIIYMIFNQYNNNNKFFNKFNLIYNNNNQIINLMNNNYQIIQIKLSIL